MECFAADQRKKRFHSGGVVCCNSLEQYRMKKKKLGFAQYYLNIQSNISLEWDFKKKSVVAKKDQIGIAQRDLFPFSDAVPVGSNMLADVVPVPCEIYELENLNNILSFEVWQTHLSENEKNLLIQFLPKGVEPHGVVEELLAGNNLHFGNSFLKWGVLLCHGHLHPDAVLHRERFRRADKKAYCLLLQNYHNNMIVNLQMWKERWATCKDPGTECMQKMSRPKKNIEKSMHTHINGSRHRDPDESLVATSESCSWGADEKTCCSVNPNLAMIHREPRKGKVFVNEKYDYLVDGFKVFARPQKGGKLRGRNIQCADGAKYMSYIKVSKEQHQRVKNSLKHSGNSIQPRSLNHVLGNLDSFHVQPFEVFEEEERQKLHDHWLLLVNRDLPSGFSDWRRLHLQKWQLTVSLLQELKNKVLGIEGKGEENSHNMLPDKSENVIDRTAITKEEEEKDGSDNLKEQPDNEFEENDSDYSSEVEEKENSDCPCGGQKYDTAETFETPIIEDTGESSSVPTESQHLQQFTSPCCSGQLHAMELETGDNHAIAETNDVSLSDFEYRDGLKKVDVSIRQGISLTSNGGIWSAVSVPGPLYHSNAVSHEYVSSGKLLLDHSQVLGEQQPLTINNMQSDLHQEDSKEALLSRQSDDGLFFCSYPNQYGNELLQSFFKGQESLTYPHEQKQKSLKLQAVANGMMETSRPPELFPEQQLSSSMMELRQKRLNDFFEHRNIQKNMYSDGGRYMPGHENYASVQDWAINTMRTSAPLHSHNNGGDLLSHNWFLGEHQAHGGWPSSGGAVDPSQSIPEGSSADQSLYSVLSEGSKLPFGSSYDSLGCMGRFMHSGNYDDVSAAGVPDTSNILPHMVNPLNYIGGSEVPGSLKVNNLGWMRLQNQNTALQDMGKPYLRSWDR